MLVGVLLGCAACLAGFAIWAWTDKGTLVVEASDPNVEIKIANEQVSIYDSLSGKSYEIRIGETPLPSGVYQLETAAEKNLVFSSSTIAIRRGQRVIVQVTLRPPATSLGQEQPSAKTSNANVPPSPAETESPEAWADKSYDPVAREEFAEVFKRLPAISIIQSNENSHPPLTFGASVECPQSLDGITSWSIEHFWTRFSENTTNSDGSLVAHWNIYYDWICDRQGRTKYVLPGGGAVLFDNRFPNLLAINSWGNTLLPDPTNNAYQITIWRLAENYAELLYRIPSSEYGNLAWDNGYRLAHLRDGRLAFFRLDTGQTSFVDGVMLHQVAFGSDCRINKNSISPNGRYVITRGNRGSGSSVDVWDLKSDRYLFSIPNAFGSANCWQWKDDSSALAVGPNETELLPTPSFDIWDIAEGKSVQSVTIDQDQKVHPLTPSSVLAGDLENNFGRVAWLSRSGELSIRNLQNNRQAIVQISDVEDSVSAELKWQADGTLNVWYGKREMKWTPTGSDVHGDLSLIGKATQTESVGPASSDETLQIQSLLAFDGQAVVIRWPIQVTDYRNYRSTSFGTARIRLDGSTSSPILVVRSSPDPDVRDRGPRDKEFVLSTSPDGKFCILMGEKTGRSKTPIFIVALSAADARYEVGEFNGEQDYLRRNLFAKTTWSPDSRFALVVAKDDQAVFGSNVLAVFDAETTKVSRIDNVDLPPAQLDRVIVWNDKFLVTLLVNDASNHHRERWLVDPKTLTALESQLFFDFTDVAVVWHQDDQLMFLANRVDEPPPVSSAARKDSKAKIRFFGQTCR